MGISDPDHRLLLEAIRQIRRRVVGEVEALSATEAGDQALTAAVLSAVVNVEALDTIAEHSRKLVLLTNALLAATVVLSVLTAILLWKMFV